jgi:hypothetical protein
MGCDNLEKNSDDQWRCECGERLCKEMRAFSKSGECSDFDSCWSKIMDNGYWKEYSAWCLNYLGKAKVRDLLKVNNKCNVEDDFGIPASSYPPELKSLF